MWDAPSFCNKERLMNNNYHPTLWRTCRVLAHPQRLACLKEVLLSPNATVEEVAAATGLPLCKASLNLRALQARGLVSVCRHSRWAHYLPQPDPLVPSAAPALAAMKRALVSDPLPSEEILATMTAFTHSRRLDILRQLTLQKRPQVEKALSAATRISPQVLWRHLKNLESRRLAVHAEGGWLLSPTPSLLARRFLALLADETR